jgi:glycosyltransferase involved in cell wall biosynthesis
MKKKKIGYVIVREDLNSPILYTQVIEMLNKLDTNKFSIYIIWLYRIDYLIKNKGAYKTFKEKVEQYGINVIKAPIITWKFPQPLVFLNFVVKQGNFIIKKMAKKYGLSILHGRGYYAGLILSSIKKKNTNITCIFDPRSPYLTEMQSTYKVRHSSKLLKRWENYEKSIVTTSDYTVAVSEAFQRYLEEVSSGNGNVVNIPNCVETLPKDNIKDLIKKNRRNAICYVGSIGTGWNNVDCYVDTVIKIHQMFPEIHYEFYVIEHEQGALRRKLLKNGMPEELFIISRIDAAEVPYRIAGCLAGLQIMKTKDTRMGIKVVDYLGAGMPVITNSLAMGASEIVNRFNVGVIDDEIDTGVNSLITYVFNNRDEIEERCLNVVENYFSTSAVAKKYSELYDKK